MISEKTGISANTVSKFRSGERVADATAVALKAGINSIKLDEVFDFDAEKMAAQGYYKQEDVKKFINNRPYEEAAKELGIEKYMLEWILKEKMVSIEFNKKYVAGRV
jgi:transcriptional regulator with XRE-family HTH domain